MEHLERLSDYPTERPYRSASARRRQRPVPENIRRYFIPLPVIKATSEAMRRFGEEERECYVWWGGYFSSEGDAQVLTAICPDMPSDFGRIYLTNQQLTVLHGRLRELDQVLLVELHTHPPGAGGQNEVDASHPAATYTGFISVVVPDFAYPYLYDLRKTYVYEYEGSGRWRTLEPIAIEQRFIVEEPFLSVEV